MSSQIYGLGCKGCIQTISRMVLLWKRSCGTRAFRLNYSLFPIRVWRCLVRTSSSQTSTELSVRERRKTLVRSTLPKIKRQPFAKDLFLGKFDKDVLAFPEVLDSAHIKEIDSVAQSAKEVVNNSRKSAEEANNETISPFALQRFKDLGFFGLEIPVEYDGAGMITTEVIRMAEAWGADLSLSLVLNNHHSVAAHAILKSGSEQLKNKYLPALASGEKIAALCLTEDSSGSDISMIRSALKPADDTDDTKGKYLLNGTKVWITGGGLADVFLIFANIPLPTAMGEIEPQLTAMIVDRERLGVRTEPIGNTLGVKGANISNVHFKDTPVSTEDFVGEIGSGLEVATDVMANSRLAIASNITGLLKEMLQIVTNHCINRKAFGKQLMDHELILKKVSRMVCTTYAIESMAYLTAGLLDSTEDPDMQLEVAMLKVYSSEGLWQCVNEALQILGAEGYRQGIVERWVRDSRALSLVDGTNDVLKLYIGLIGCGHAGETLADTVEKRRHPLFNPVFVAKKIVQMLKYQNDNIKLDMDLCGYLHPSLKEAADWMEFCVKKFGFIVEIVLSRHGADTTFAQIDLERMAKVATEIYCMAAVLSRASRSYCIGLRNEFHELSVAITICRESHDRVKGYIREMENGPIDNNDTNNKAMAEKTFHDKSYSLVSPITRNW